MMGIKDIAKAAGVSVSTVSNVINGKKNVGEATREKIWELCEEMSYFPGNTGKKMRPGNTKTILFNFSDFDRTFYLSIINGINDYATGKGFDLMICTNRSFEKFVKSGLTSGCIILDVAMKNDTVLCAAGEHYPIVLLDRQLEHPNIKSILVNNYDPMAELIQGMINRGYKRFCFIGGLENTDDNKERYKAFMDVLEQNKITFHERNYYSGDYRQKSGYMAAKIMMVSGQVPECIVCANDNMAIGAISAFKEAGYKIPADVAITGFDNCILAEPMGLTTVDIPNYERGYLAAQYLIDNIRGHRNTDTLKIAAQLRWRKTVGTLENGKNR